MSEQNSNAEERDDVPKKRDDEADSPSADDDATSKMKGNVEKAVGEADAYGEG